MLGDWVLIATQVDGDNTFSGVPLQAGFNSFSLRGSSEQGDHSKLAPALVILRHAPPAAPATFTATPSGGDVQLGWTPVADPDLEGYDLARDGTPLGYAVTPLPYAAGTHVLAGNYGVLADWQRLVDGNAGTFWSLPGAAYSTGVTFEWLWDSPVYLGSVALTSQSPASQIRIDVQVASGEWLWLYQAYSWNSFLEIGLGIEAKALRLSVPPYHCNNCRLSELQLRSETRPAAPPYLDSGVGTGAAPYSIATLNRYGQSSPVKSAIALVGVTAPESPRNLVAEEGGCDAIAVSWQPPAVEPAIPAATGSTVPAAPALSRPWWTSRRGRPPSPTSTCPTGRRSPTGRPPWPRSAASWSKARPRTKTPPPPPAPRRRRPFCSTPTTAGNPVYWPGQDAAVGGRGWPGSAITLRHEGNPVATLSLSAAAAEQSFDLPGYEGDLQVAGGYAVYVGSQGAGAQVMRYEFATGATVVAPAADPGQPALSPDGRRAVWVEAGSPSDLWLYDFDAVTATRLTSDAAGESRPLFLPDGRSLLFLSHGATDKLQRLDLASGAISTVIESGSPDLEDFALAEDGRQAMIRTWQGPWIVDTATGELEQPYWWTTPNFGPTPFAPGGGKVVFTMPDWGIDWAQLYVADLVNGGVSGISQQTGEFGATFLDEGTVVLWQRTGDGSLRLVSRSLYDGEERVLLAGIDPAEVPYYGQAPLFREGDGVLWALVGERLFRIQQPSGQFVVPGLMLHAGPNFFDARQAFGGDVQDAEADRARRRPGAFGDAEAVAIDLAPAFPVAGQVVVVQGTYRNNGPADLYGICRPTWCASRPAAPPRWWRAPRSTSMPARPAGCATTSTPPAPTATTCSAWRSTRPASLVESDEANNELAKTLAVRATHGLEATWRPTIPATWCAIRCCSPGASSRTRRRPPPWSRSRSRPPPAKASRPPPPTASSPSAAARTSPPAGIPKASSLAPTGPASWPARAEWWWPRLPPTSRLLPRLAFTVTRER